MNVHEKINYVEFPANNINKTKKFFESAFAWTFTDYGPEYTAFSGEGLDGGFFKSEQYSSAENGAALIVFYSKNIEQTLAKIKQSGGEIIQAIFPFPGGRRFHFKEPSGNEFAVWSDIN
ncbi:MAG: VOC family protein [Psychromonas sp.]